MAVNRHRIIRNAMLSVMGALALTACESAMSPPPAPDPLPSWNDGPVKSAVREFVQAVSDPDGADYMPPPERVAVFDNDGTLWSEQPLYFQIQFALDRIRSLAADHPEWRDDPVFRASLCA